MEIPSDKIIEFGTGDVAISIVDRGEKQDSIAFIKRDKSFPIAVTVDDDMTEDDFLNGLRIMFSFNNVKSIDAILHQLHKLKRRMGGLPMPSECPKCESEIIFDGDKVKCNKVGCDFEIE